MSAAQSVLRYEPIPQLSREDALALIDRGGAASAPAIYSMALHDREDAFAEQICLEALKSDDAVVRYAAVGAFGEMAAFAGRNIDFAAAERRLVQMGEIYPELAGRIEEALDDFAFAKRKHSKVDGGAI